MAKKRKLPEKNGFVRLYFNKLVNIISKEGQFFKEHPHLKRPRDILVAAIIIMFYAGVLALASKGLASILFLLKIPYHNYLAVGISILVLVGLTIKDMVNNPIKMEDRK